MGHIVIVSGPPGAGKSTVSPILAEKSPYERTVCIHTDDFYNNICKGYIAPYKPEAEEQNVMVSKIMASCVKQYAEAGYEVLVDGLILISGWVLAHWIEIIKSEIDLHYAILLPDVKTMFLRNESRGDKFSPGGIKGITGMHHMFSECALYKSHFIDTSNQSPDETATAIRNMVTGGSLLINKNLFN